MTVYTKSLTPPPSARQDFSVQNTSTVKIIQNGQEIQNLMLNPGNYSLRNIPLAIGANAIQLQITDEAGRITTRTLDFFFDSTLLAPGVHDFGYGIGAPLKFEGTERNYRTGEMIISGYHRLGLNNSTTAGINFRANSSQQLLGGELTRVMPIGTASIQTATSNHASSGTGHALIGQLKSENSSQKSNTGGSYWLTQLSQYTERFSTSPESSTVNSVNTELAMRYSTTLTDNISLSVSGLHQRLRTAEQSRFTEAATIRYRLDNRSSLWLSFEKRIRPESGYRADYVAFLGFRHTFEKIRGDASISYDSSRRATTIQTQASTGAPGQQWNGGFRLYSGDDNSLAAANLAYAGSRFEWSSLHETINSALGGAGRSRDFASFGTALIVADGLFSISRPVNDSFYIVKPNPRIADKSLGINPSNNIYQAVSDWAGPPASSWLTSYIENSVAVDILDSTPGYDPGNDRPVLLPTYKSGIIVPIGTAAATMVSGFILNEKGLPLALGAGRLVSSDSPPATFPFFTNRRGSFRSEPLPPGNYAIMVDGSAKPLGRFSIKPEDEGIMEIGQYRIQ